ncbi:MAG TPA: ABC transporter ATP-binding protein [Candidatus Thermoplasmatota archaeon]|nr:ABC transporter ATP-binding protein [Candidatus Thermoplasmatota archaeon]
MKYAIETQNLTRRYGEFVAVDGVNLAVPTGTIYGYLGLNGAGKSTTIKMLTTLIRPTAGHATVAGHDIVSEPLAIREIIGLVGDEGADSRPSWTGREYLGYFARIRGMPRAEDAVREALDAVRLDPRFRHRAIASYSTGMKRRVDLARALLSRPRVLFLDEPTRGLDLPSKRETWELLRRLAREQDVTVFLSSHDATEVHELCANIAIVARGRLTYSGPAATLGSDPRAFEAALIKLLEGTGSETPQPTRQEENA